MQSTRALIVALRACAIVAALALAAGCGPKKGEGTGVENPDTVEGTDEEAGPAEKPYVKVPTVLEYGWLKTANILIGRPGEISSMTKKIEDYYSGYPSLLKVLKLITKDRSVAVKDNPVYLSDLVKKYYELVGASEASPFLAVEEYDLGIMKNALYLCWKQENALSPIDNYDDCVVRTDYGK